MALLFVISLPATWCVVERFSFCHFECLLFLRYSTLDRPTTASFGSSFGLHRLFASLVLCCVSLGVCSPARISDIGCFDADSTDGHQSRQKWASRQLRWPGLSGRLLVVFWWCWSASAVLIKITSACIRWIGLWRWWTSWSLRDVDQKVSKRQNQPSILHSWLSYQSS